MIIYDLKNIFYLKQFLSKKDCNVLLKTYYNQYYDCINMPYYLWKWLIFQISYIIKEV